MGRAAAGLPWAVALAGVAFLVASVAGRIGSVDPLEWMEGASLQHALRLLSGAPLYTAPRADFIPFLYPPLGYLPMALAAWFWGPSLVAARAANAVALLLASLALWRMASRLAAGDARAGALGLGLWAAGFAYAGGFIDLARIDVPFLCLVAWGAERLVAGRVVSGLAWLVLSVFAKQHGLVFLGAALGWLWLQRGRAALWPGAASVACLVALGALLQWHSAGWFLTYTWSVPASHGVVAPLLARYLLVDVLLLVPALGIPAWIGLLRARAAPGVEHALLLAGLCASALGRAHPGGDDNVLLPGYLMLCGVAAPRLWRGLCAGSARVRFATGLLIVAQLALLWQAPSRQDPGPATRQGFVRLRAALAACAQGGRSAALDFPSLGGTPVLHTLALSDLRMAGATPLAHAGSAALLAWLDGPGAPAALAVGESFPGLDRSLRARYELCRTVPRFALPTGYQPPSQRVYRLSRKW